MPNSNPLSGIRWNWQAIQESVRGDDMDAQSITVSNLSNQAMYIQEILPVLAAALSKPDPMFRFIVEDACSQLGREMSDEQVAWLETQKDTPGLELAARIVLLGRYFLAKAPDSRAARTTHIFYIVDRYPERGIAAAPDAAILKRDEPVAYEAVRQLWLKQCEVFKSNAAVQGNSARFFLINDAVVAEKLLRRAQQLEPDNAEWHELLAQLHSLTAMYGADEVRTSKARQSLVELEMAEQIRSAHSGDMHDEEARVTELLSRSHSLPNRAKAAFDAGELDFARQFAEECLTLANSAELPEFFRNDGNSIFYGHLILGRVALRDGNVARAKEHLIASGNTAGSPNLSSFGPNLSLAKDMLERGEREIVLEFFELCEKFWKMGGDQLAHWKEQVSRNEVPEFGANLIY